MGVSWNEEHRCGERKTQTLRVIFKHSNNAVNVTNNKSDSTVVDEEVGTGNSSWAIISTQQDKFIRIFLNVGNDVSKKKRRGEGECQETCLEHHERHTL